MIRGSRTFERLIKAVTTPGKRQFILQGGTSSTKTFSVLQLFYLMALQADIPLLFSVVSESVPHLRRGVLRDWMQILGEDYDPNKHNKSEETFKIGKCTVEFFAVDHPDKARGGRRDFLFVNECNRIPLPTFEQLAVRTRRLKFLDFNPSARFWAHEIAHGDDTETWFDVSTYRDAIGPDGKWLIPESVRLDIESRRATNPAWYKVYGLGEIGNLEGLIIPRFVVVDHMPNIETTVGIDWGFANDAAVVVEVGKDGKRMFINELIHGLGYTNQDLGQKMREKRVPDNYTIYYDSAEPKSGAELRHMGFYNARACFKGEDAFRYGVDYINRFEINVTQNSAGVIKDLRNACWKTDDYGKPTNKPAHGFLNSIDAIRYALTEYLQPPATVRGGNI